MKRFFDTSVLVAAVLEEHEVHAPSFRAFSAATPSSAFCAAHNLAEVYATLTRYPGKQRLSADQALLSIDVIQRKLTIVALDTKEYILAIRKFAALGISGGTTYDALIATCALKVKADIIYTWNVGHFALLGDEVAQKVRTP
jgi:predicted nucleic acid-binding protein